MIKEKIKFQDSLIFEGMTSLRAIIKGNEAGINDRKIKKVLFDTKRLKKISKEVGYLKAVSSNMGFTVEPTTELELEKITLGNSHGGIVAIAEERSIPSLSTDSILPNGFYAMIQGIEDPYNFGYSIRSLYACGCDGLILGERNWFSAAGVVCRSSAGASELMSVYKANDLDAISCFKNMGYSVVCADENTDSILGECALPLPVLLVVGGEKRGISKSVLDLADMRVKINYSRSFNASLSAASATTMFAYEIMRQNTKNEAISNA